MQLLTTAQDLANAGCCVIPTRPDGTKAPAVDWKQYQHHHPTPQDLWAWFNGSTYDGLGIVCGTVSGGLEMLELEGRALHLAAQLSQLLTDHGAQDLWARLNTGYLERTPSGGIHWLYRVIDGAPRGNTKLARRPGEGTTVDVLIETRGEGGFVVVAPSAGRTHPTGQAWTMLAGGPSTIPNITAAERDLLYDVARLLDEMPAREAPTATTAPTPAYSGDMRPGDDYNTRASWDDILAPHGWQRVRRDGQGWAWVRPGKEARDGISATTGKADDADRLYVFTSSTTFEQEIPYSKFAAFAHLEHGDDYAAATKALRAKGFGAPLEEPRPTLTWAGPPTSAGVTGQDGQAPSGPPVTPVTNITEPSSYSLTDDGNALRLVDQHHNQIRYCPQRGLWLTWAGHRWIWDEAETIRELARGIARDLPTTTGAHTTHKKKSLGSPAIGYQVRLAQTDPRVTVHIDKLDAHPYQLNTPGGVVDLRTGKLHPADPGALHTRSTTVTPDWTLPAPRWLRFLADTFAGDPELTTYVQRLLGVSLIGEVLEQMLPFAYGSGANGKTTLLNTVQRLIGIGEGGYAISAPAEILLATRNQDHPAVIAQMSGARMVVTSELEDGQHFAEARVKQLTGSDPINARFMRQNPFTFIPTHTLWLLANHQPSVKAGGPAFWRRIAMLPFFHTVPIEQRDPHLEDVLVHEEGPAVLAWVIQGAADYLATTQGGGLAMPAAVKAASEAYERDQDTVARFVDDMCELGRRDDPLFKTKVAAIRADYESWCRIEGEFPVSAKAFTQTLMRRFEVETTRDSSTRYYLGICHKEPSNASSNNEPWELRWDQK